MLVYVHLFMLFRNKSNIIYCRAHTDSSGFSEKNQKMQISLEVSSRICALVNACILSEADSIGVISDLILFLSMK